LSNPCSREAGAQDDKKSSIDGEDKDGEDYHHVAVQMVASIIEGVADSDVLSGDDDLRT
jgi:hypothetical protein